MGTKFFALIVAVMTGVCMVSLIPGAGAGDFDGSKPLYGVTGKIVEVNAFRISENVDPDTLGIPEKFLIDFKAGVIRPSRDSLIKKTIAIQRVAHVENNLVLQGVDTGVDGVDDDYAWSMTISKKDGKAVLAASGRGVGYVAFGACAVR